MSLTKQEKIELAKAEVEIAKNMIAYSRRDVDKWLNTLEIRQEYLEAVTKGSDLELKDVKAKLSPANPPKSPQRGGK